MTLIMEMDAGLAAVVAGVAGFLGAVIGSTVQGRATRRAAEAQAEGGVRAAVEGATRAGDAAVRQIAFQTQALRADWLRQQRVDASLGFLSAYDSFAASGAALRKALDRGEVTDITTLAEAVRETDNHAAQSYFRVRVFGPDSLKESALQLRNQIHATTDALHARIAALTNGADQDLAERHATEQVELAAQRHSAFVNAIQGVIGELEF
ncbi:hypothetical protein [Streptomyces griseoaurantiacus]|uniref:hypothetical protein n=1 Tax=Streptomyces griseoaurantiacus TaxID=68213 RepID=UPI00324DE87B